MDPNSGGNSITTNAAHLRFAPMAPDALGEFLVTPLARTDATWWNQRSVVTLYHIRQRKLRRAG